MRQAPLLRVLIATDIFGHTPEVQDLARRLGAATRIVSPYGGERPRFGSEMEAYAAFSARTSVEKFAGELATRLSEVPFDLALGFSAGASALWLCLAQAAPWLPGQALLYYGSRIRDAAALTPACPTRLVFAEREASFDPAGLVHQLKERGLDARLVAGSAHGFMNPLSPGHDPALAAQELARIRTLLADVSAHSGMAP